MKKNTVDYYESIALSDKHIFNILGGKNNLVLYPDLIKYSSIDEVLGPNGMCVLLFEAKKNYGHWCCLWKLDENTVSFFNSYGGFPDDSLKFIPEHFAEISNQNYPYLSILLDKSPYELTYNERQYQKKGKGINTCGRHCSVRLICRHMDDDQYNEFIKFFTKRYSINPDELVTLLTMNPKEGY